MRVYEELFIVKPEATEEEVDHVIEQMKGVVAQAGGSINKVDKWGKRKLAYRVGKYREGEYVLLEFQSGPETVHELERRLRVADLVIKFLTVRIDENLKRIEKRKKQREKRSARKAIMSPSVPQPSVAQQMLGTPMPGPAPAPAAPAPAAPMPAHPQAVMPVPAAPEKPQPRTRHRTRGIRTWQRAEEDQSARPSGPPAAIRLSRRKRNNISAARKFAVSASRRSTISITKTPGCLWRSSPNAARSCPAAYPERARRTNGA